ncbi:MAG TPA: DUF1697 domain-containing protein [Burkholderiaceae bacterium]|nr:DUF1697 domain-containing protein [Burkholderiaceae bacterium]
MAASLRSADGLKREALNLTMTRFVAFLRGVTPMNVKMPELKGCFDAAGFTNVRTILSSGNVAFDARASSEASLERAAEQAMQQGLGRSFYTIVRPSTYLAELLASDPYVTCGIPSHAKRVISFLREARAPRIELPLARDQASVFCLLGREAFTAYLPTDKGPVFMRLIELAFGTDVTTRTWDTVAKCAAA